MKSTATLRRERNQARAEVERLRKSIEHAHALMGEHKFDQARAVLSSSVGLYARHFAEVQRRQAERVATNEEQR